jgi:hypothetical protein
LLRNCLLVSLLVACTFLSGCGRHHGEVTFQTDGVTQTVRQGQIALRAGFPLPIYPGAQPSGSVDASSSQSHEDDKYLMLFSNDDLGKIKDFYSSALTNTGWRLKNAQQTSDMVNMTAQKDDQEAAVMLTRSSDKTTISLSVSRAQSGIQPPNTNSAIRSATNKLNLPDD